MRTPRRALSLAVALVLSVGATTATVPHAAAAESATVVTEGEGGSARGPGYTDAQRRVLDLVNATRARHGRAGLTFNATLVRKAQRWAQHLAGVNRLVHSNLTDGVPGNWLDLGENVGRGRTIAIVHRTLLNQPQHRDLILGRFNRIGTGVATAAGGQVYVVQVFMRV